MGSISAEDSELHVECWTPLQFESPSNSVRTFRGRQASTASTVFDCFSDPLFPNMDSKALSEPSSSPPRSSLASLANSPVCLSTSALPEYTPRVPPGWAERGEEHVSDSSTPSESSVTSSVVDGEIITPSFNTSPPASPCAEPVSSALSQESSTVSASCARALLDKLESQRSEVAESVMQAVIDHTKQWADRSSLIARQLADQLDASTNRIKELEEQLSKAHWRIAELEGLLFAKSRAIQASGGSSGGSSGGEELTDGSDGEGVLEKRASVSSMGSICDLGRSTDSLDVPLTKPVSGAAPSGSEPNQVASSEPRGESGAAEERPAEERRAADCKEGQTTKSLPTPMAVQVPNYERRASSPFANDQTSPDKGSEAGETFSSRPRRLAILKALSQTPFSAENAGHMQLLEKLWKRLYPNDAGSSETRDWTVLGFEESPEALYEKEHVLALHQVGYFAERCKSMLEKIMDEHMCGATLPLGVVGLKLTSTLLWLLDDNSEEHEELDRTFLMLMAHPKAFEEIYCIAFRIFRRMWRTEEGPRDLDTLAKRTEDSVMSLLSQKPKDLQELLILFSKSEEQYAKNGRSRTRSELLPTTPSAVPEGEDSLRISEGEVASGEGLGSYPSGQEVVGSIATSDTPIGGPDE